MKLNDKNTDLKNESEEPSEKSLVSFLLGDPTISYNLKRSRNSSLQYIHPTAAAETQRRASVILEQDRNRQALPTPPRRRTSYSSQTELFGGGLLQSQNGGAARGKPIINEEDEIPSTTVRFSANANLESFVDHALQQNSNVNSKKTVETIIHVKEQELTGTKNKETSERRLDVNVESVGKPATIKSPSSSRNEEACSNLKTASRKMSISTTEPGRMRFIGANLAIKREPSSVAGTNKQSPSPPSIPQRSKTIEVRNLKDEALNGKLINEKREDTKTNKIRPIKSPTKTMVEEVKSPKTWQTRHKQFSSMEKVEATQKPTPNSPKFMKNRPNDAKTSSKKALIIERETSVKNTSSNELHRKNSTQNSDRAIGGNRPPLSATSRVPATPTRTSSLRIYVGPGQKATLVPKIEKKPTILRHQSSVSTASRPMLIKTGSTTDSEKKPKWFFT